ncbi:hypothetical protein HYDPIDRAFT_76209, partial [Hydnomerulius pinastri MD-312]
GISENEEQECAFRIVGEHIVSGSQEQLLMYIAGIGGSGKSHIINAVMELFHAKGLAQKLLLSALTGCAAILISGYTIHALTFLPK